MDMRARTKQSILAELADLRARTLEAEDVLRAIRNYEIDALIVQAPGGDRVFALETADHAYRQMVEQMREGAATLTTGGLVLFANHRLARLLQCPSDQILGAPFANHLPPAEHPALAALLRDPGGGRIAGHIQTPTGARLPVSFSASRILIDEEPAVLLLITDLTYEKQADRVSKLLHLTTLLAAAVTPAQVEAAIVEGALQVFGAPSGFVALPAEPDGSLRTRNVVGYSADQAQPLAAGPLPPGHPATDAASQGVPVVVETAADRLARYPGPTAAGPAGALLAIPLLLPDRLAGVLQVDFEGGWPLERDDQDFLLTVAQQCAQALERAALYSDLEQRIKARTAELLTANVQLATANRQLQVEMAERRAMQGLVERAREEARMRIGRELHDMLGGDLAGLKMDVSRIMRGDPPPEELRRQLANINRSIDAAIGSVRRLSTELRPQILDELGLVPALEAHFQEFLKRTGLTGELTCALEDNVLQGDAATACFRIAQEALTNVMRHAQATHVSVRLELVGELVQLQVTDNGHGLTPAERAVSGRLGLVGMQERANLMAAHFEIISAPGQGTTVLVRIPLPPSPPRNHAPAPG